MIHFVFEMQALRLGNDSEAKRKNKLLKITLISIMTVHVIIYTTTRVVQEGGTEIGKTGHAFVLFALVLKFVSDFVTYYIFI